MAPTEYCAGVAKTVCERPPPLPPSLPTAVSGDTRPGPATQHKTPYTEHIRVNY